MSDAKMLAWRDAEAVASCGFIPWDEAVGVTFVVTGATGLIGGAVVRAIAARNRLAGADIRLVVPVRDVARAERLLDDVPSVELVEWDASVDDGLTQIEGADYVIHCAAPTSSAFFSDSPVETIDTVVGGTRSMLGFAQRCGASLVLTSSMEVYGAGAGVPLDESRTAGMDTQNPRNSYPAAKVAAEALCAAFASEFGMRACVARLAQSFGPGVARGDGRVFAEFARSCLAGEDICLHTTGAKENMYVYTADAASALLLLALRGEGGLAYNVANEGTLTNVRAMAEAVAGRFGNGRTSVVFDIDEEAARRYRPDGSLRLDTARLCALGWRPTFGLMDMYERLIGSWREDGV